MDFITTRYEKDKPFAHMFFFQLSDTNKELVNKFIELSEKYLSGYPGQEHFSVGWRVLDINRDVSAKDFEVSIHMIFRNIKAFDNYQQHDRHQQFITESAGMSPVRIVYDSFLQLSKQPVADKKEKNQKRKKI